MNTGVQSRNPISPGRRAAVANHTKSLAVGIMPHAQSVNDSMSRYTDPMQAELIHKALDAHVQWRSCFMSSLQRECN